jgi:hypothetical protein
MDDFKQVLLDRLVKKGADPSSLSSILKALSKILAEDPGVDPGAANERLRYLGWQEVQVDYHILQLALACFELQTGTGAPSFGEDQRARQALRLRNVEIAPIALNDL